MGPPTLGGSSRFLVERTTDHPAVAIGTRVALTDKSEDLRFELIGRMFGGHATRTSAYGDVRDCYLAVKKKGLPKKPVDIVHSPSAPAGTATHMLPSATPPVYNSPTSSIELGMTPQYPS